MRLFLTDWFGWSFLWLLPLLGSLFLSLASAKTRLRGPGSIRFWLGTVAVLSASSAIEAMLRTQGGHLLDGDQFGQGLARQLTLAIGQPMAVLVLFAGGLLGLYWLCRAGKARHMPATDGLRAQPSVRHLAEAHPLPIAKNLPADPAAMPATSDSVTRKRDPWPLPNALSHAAERPNTATAKWPQLPTKADRSKPAARPPSEWAPFESLRPTQAMLARAATPAPAVPAAVTAPSAMRTSGPGVARRAPTRGSNVRISTASDCHQAISTALRSTLHAQSAPLTAAPAASAAFPVDIPPPAAVMTTAPPPERLAPRALASAIAPASSDDRRKAPAIEPGAWATAADRAQPAGSTPTAQPWQAPAVIPAATLNAATTAVTPCRPTNVPLPDIALLDQGNDAPLPMEAAQLTAIGQLIEQRLKEFKVPVTVLGACAGPVITRYEIEPALGVRGAQIVNLMKDLARALGLTSIRVVETIPGKTCMGLELPNHKRQMIRLAEIFRADAYRHAASHLTLAMGKDITGVPVAVDLARAPHMLVAGTTGSGKSVAINAMILSLLFKATPDEVRLIMIDPKMLELSVYDGIPHLLAPVVTDMKLAAHALSWCVAEMDKRYRLMSALGVRNLAGYNQKICDGIAAEKYVKNPFSLTPDAPEPLAPLPMIVVVIDELADLMMVAGKKIEELIARLAQKARAAGIHLILATQRPSVDVITGLIKANIPTRVAFQVSSKIDSRTVLDQMGAETLLGHGDMLFLPPGSGYPQRVHGAFVSDEEVHRVVEHLKAHGEPHYEEAILAGPVADEPLQSDIQDEAGNEADPLYDEAVAYISRSRRASISSVQRQFRIGYNRAARLVEQMEAAGILSAMSKSGSRDVLTPPPAC